MKTILRIILICAAACSGPKQHTQAAPPVQAPPPPPPDAGVVAAAPESKPAAQASKPAEPEPPLMPEESFRDQQPAPLPTPPQFEPPVPVERKLKNGARVLVVENHQVPLVAIDVRFLHGVDADPLDAPGLAEFVADMVDEGTTTRPAGKLAEEIEDLAAHLSTGASLESSSVHLNCLTETLPQALALLADVVRNPAFRKEDVDRVRVLRLTQLEQKKASLAALAADEASRILYGPVHPWGKPSGGTPESLSAIASAQLAAFHQRYWIPNDAVISVSGDVKPEAMVKLLESALAGWKKRPLRKLALPPFPRLPGRSIDALEKPSATQSQVWVVGRLFKVTDPDAVPLRVANMTLGGLFTSRLNMNLREKHGYTYGVSSRLSLLRESGTFVASGGIIAKSTVPALTEFEGELTRFSSGEVTEAELASAKEALVRGLPSSLETNDAVSGAMSNLVSLGLPLDYYQTIAARIGKVTLADVRRVVTRWIRPLAWPVVVVGPQGKQGLESLKLDAPPSAPAAAATPAPAAAAPAESRPAPAEAKPASPPGDTTQQQLTGKLAVLELRNFTKDLTRQNAQYFTDVVRGAALKAQPQLQVMTRENLMVLLRASGRDLADCEGECEVDTGRRIGADQIVSGEIQRLGTLYKISLRLHDTHEGRLLASTQASGKSIEELDADAQRAARELLTAH